MLERIPSIRFYGYTQYRGTDGFIGFHVEDIDLINEFGLASLNDSDLDDRQPLFLNNDTDHQWCRMMSELPRREQILEITFEVKASETYVTEDYEHFCSLYVFPVPSYDGRDLCLFSPVGQELIDKGFRWFILANDPEGRDQSFIALPSTVVCKVLPIFIPL